jgi:hypothetical protein
MTLKTLQIAAVIGATIALPAISFAGGFTANFNNLAPGQTLSGQEDPAGSGQFWDTNNTNAGGLGQSDFVGVIPNYSTSTSDYWAALGGISGFAPVVQTSYLFHPANLAGAANATFNVDFAITGPQSPRTVKDTFGWTLQNSAGNQLLRVGFIPDINQPTNLTIRVFNAANMEVLGTNSNSGLFNLFYDSKYSFNFTLNAANQYSVRVQDKLGNAPVTIINGLPAGFLPAAAVPHRKMPH